MKVLLFVFALICCSVSIRAFGQDGTDQSNTLQLAQQDTLQDTAQNPDQSPPQNSPSQSQPSATQQSNRSVLDVAPGTEALKDKDLYEKTGYFHPFRRMTRFALKDQERIWTSPFHTSKSDAKYWAIFGGAAAALIAFDARIQRNAPSPTALVKLGTDGSSLGAAYTLIPISAGFYFIGSHNENERFRETGLLAFETLIDTTIVEEALKVITNRQRPLEGSGQGHFFRSNDRVNSSFPSGHSINTFGLASIFAHEYSHTWWVKALAYAYAGGVAGARLAANRHFPSDTLVGGATGWFIGDYVYAKRHNRELDQKPTAMQKVLEHVRIGAQIY